MARTITGEIISQIGSEHFHWRSRDIIFGKSYRSRYGNCVLERLIDSSRHLKVECNNSQLLLAFALFGIQVLASDSELRDLYQILASHSDSDRSADSCDGDGGCSD